MQLILHEFYASCLLLYLSKFYFCENHSNQNHPVVFIRILETTFYTIETLLDVSIFIQICLYSLKRFLIENLTESYFLK